MVLGAPSSLAEEKILGLLCVLDVSVLCLFLTVPVNPLMQMTFPILINWTGPVHLYFKVVRQYLTFLFKFK